MGLCLIHYAVQQASINLFDILQKFGISKKKNR